MTSMKSDTVGTVAQSVSDAPADRLVERLAGLVGAKVGVRAVFGDPVRRETVTVIPVARVRWGFGGGGGSADGPPGGPASGSGGGGGVAADPVGYIEIGPEGPVFRPIRELYPSPLFVLASGLAAAMVLRAVGRLFHR